MTRGNSRTSFSIPPVSDMTQTLAASPVASRQSQVATTAASILMCPPDHFGIEYEINAWMDVDNPCDTKKARVQWATLKHTLEKLGARIELINPERHPDLVFSANAGLVKGRTFIPSRFLHPERQGEEKYWQAWFANAGFEIAELPEEVFFEGAGDALFAGETLFGGYGFRTERSAYDTIEKIIDSPIVRLELRDERFYHFDTCFCPLDENQAIYFPGAFTDESIAALKKHLVCHAVPEEDAVKFACNAVVIDRNVVLQSGCAATEEMLARIGFTPHTVDMSEFRKSGGSSKCLTIRLN